MSQNPAVNIIDNFNSFQIKPKYTKFFQKITSSAKKAKYELSKVAEQINGKSYKCIDKTIEQQQKKENYSLSTNHIPQQETEQNSDNFDASEGEWIEIKITKQPKTKPLMNNQDIIMDSKNKVPDTERKSYLNTIQSLNAENNQINSNEAIWKCGQCTLIQHINNNQCVLCQCKNSLFESDEKDHSFALELQQKYQTMKDDEKLAIELQRIEDEQAQNMGIQIRSRKQVMLQSAHREKSQNSPHANPFVFANLTDFDCMICLESKSAEYRHIISNCGHTFCRDCLRGHILNYNKPELPDCPLPKCNAKMADHIDIQTLVTENEYRQLHEKIDQAAISKLKYLKQCLTPDCKYAVELFAGTKLVCPVCNNSWCTKCQVKWHSGITCAERTRNNVQQRDREYDEWKVNKSGSVKSCPSCHNHVEKNGGCNHMRCVCGSHWCWVCVVEIDGNNLQRHFSRNHPMFGLRDVAN